MRTVKIFLKLVLFIWVFSLLSGCTALVIGAYGATAGYATSDIINHDERKNLPAGTPNNAQALFCYLAPGGDSCKEINARIADMEQAYEDLQRDGHPDPTYESWHIAAEKWKKRE